MQHTLELSINFTKYDLVVLEISLGHRVNESCIYIYYTF